MDTEGIKRWLAGSRPYKQGVALYQAHGASQALKDLFAKGELSFTKKKLATALEELLQQGSAAAKPAPVSPSFPKNSPKTSEARKDQAHPQAERMRPLLDQRTLLHAQLERMSPEERPDACLRIVALTREISALYFNLEKPAPQPTDFTQITDRAELKQQLTNMRSLRSKLKNNPKRRDELPALEEKIKTVSQLLNQTPND